MEGSIDSDMDVCPDCGAELPAWAAGGNCPACLLGGSRAGEEPSGENRPSSGRAGVWQLFERIGEGAFGIVYAAEQAKPVRRSAAVKVLRPGVGSKEVLARFEAESQALALMNHPDVVTIYEAGVTEDERPFIAMEFVPGQPVTDFAADLSLGEKLTLFDRICGVVEHAHRRGLIHRDLKPDNILVYRDANGEIILKLLDFGIAKATEQVLTDSTVLTAEGHFLGTPEYMSPDQIDGADVDTRADVYSLGIVLFELLAGRPPFVLESQSLDAVIDFLSRVRDEDAPRPSAVSPNRVVEDLDWIVGKAIEKERERRYQSVVELREDLRRYRKNQAIKARPPATSYLVGKFVRRHWKLVTVIVSVASIVTASAVVSGVMAIRTQEASRETNAAYSASDLRSAVEAIEERRVSQGIALLIRALRTDPENVEATRFLRATLDQFPLSDLTFEKAVADENLRNAYFIDDDIKIVAVTELGNVHLLDTDGNEVAPTIRLGGTRQRTALDPTAGWMVVTNVQGSVELIDLRSFQEVTLEEAEDGFGANLAAIGFSSSGEYLCAAKGDGRVRMWRTQGGKKIWERTLGSPPESLAFFNNGADVAIATRDGKLLELASFTGEENTDQRSFAEPVHFVSSAADGYRYFAILSSGKLVGCDKGKPAYFFDETPVEVPVVNTIADRRRDTNVFFGEHEVSVWRFQGKTTMSRLILAGRPSAVGVFPDRSVALVGSAESGVRIWDFGRGGFVASDLPRTKNSGAISVDTGGTRAVCMRLDGVIQHYRLPDIQTTDEKAIPVFLPDQWTSVAYSDRNDYLNHLPAESLRTLIEVPAGVPRSLAADPERKRIFAAYPDAKIRYWDLATGELLGLIETESKSTQCLDVSPDGTLLSFRDRFRHVTIYEMETGQRRHVDIDDRRGVSSVAFSPDGSSFATGSNSGSVRLWDTDTGAPLTDLLEHDLRGTVLAHHCRFSGNGNLLVSWGVSDGKFRLWDAESGETVGVLPVDGGTPRYARFLSEDRHIATVTEREDGRYLLRIWSVETSTPVTPYRMISPECFDFSSLKIPSDQPFSEGQLDDIEQRNGLRIGDLGVTEIPFTGPEQVILH